MAATADNTRWRVVVNNVHPSYSSRYTVSILWLSIYSIQHDVNCRPTSADDQMKQHPPPLNAVGGRYLYYFGRCQLKVEFKINLILSSSSKSISTQVQVHEPAFLHTTES